MLNKTEKNYISMKSVEKEYSLCEVKFRPLSQMSGVELNFQKSTPQPLTSQITHARTQEYQPLPLTRRNFQ